MARNRKRAKERRARRPQVAPVATPARRGDEGNPDPLEHATPDVELAEAQLALGRPELIGEPSSGLGDPAALEPPEFDDLEVNDLDGADGAGTPPPASGTVIGADGGTPTPGAGTAVAARRAHPGSRLVSFVQGSWRELQRVQWPDRRQVMQATGVVIGFVIVAGLFLGVADFVAAKLMDFILK
jgi:preprotein translocase SecE subunit